jgi:hypothetical protein
MRWSRDARFRAVARRRTGIAFLVLALGTLLFLNWMGTAPQPVLGPEGGGHAREVDAVSDGRNWDVARNGRSSATDATEPSDGAGSAQGGQPTAGGAPAPGSAREAIPTDQLAKETNPLNLLVDGTGFVRFLGFTAISLGFAVVVLVFFWSHRRDLS